MRSNARPQQRLALGGLVSLALLLSACGGTSSTTGAGSSSSGPAAQLASSQCNKSTGLTVYSAQGYDSDATKAFQQQTGITTNLVDDSTGNILAKVASEGANPQWDVLWFDGNVTMQDLDNKGYLLKWKSSNISNYNAQGQSLIPSDYAYYPSGVTAAGAIVYNTTKAPATLPQTWSDLTNPMYKGMMAENDPAYSGPAYPFIAGVSQVLGGESQGKAYFQALKANGDTIFQTNDPTLTSVKTGAKEFAIVQDSAYYGAVAGGAKNLGIIYPTDGVAALPSEMGVGVNSQHKACAEEFVNWIMSPAGQQVMTHHDPTDGDTYFIELINGVTPVVQRQTTGINFVTLNVQTWAGVEDEYKQWFHDNIVAG